MIWSDKHRPAHVSEMIGNEESRAAIVSWLAKWKPGTKPVLMVGPPGIGKTTMAFALADQFGYDMIGLNASDARSKSKLAEILNPVLGNAGVTGKPAMIFIDEVDGIHGRSDYGGASALAEIISRANVPIILAANDDTSDKIKPVLKAAAVVRFRRVPPRLLRAYLEDVLKSEDTGSPDSPAKKLTYGLLIKTVNRSRGDIRSMINLAQSYATGFNPQTETPDDALTFEQAIPAFFGASSAAEAYGVLRCMPSDPREKIGAFYSSIVTSKALKPAASAALLQVISDADVLYGRILRTQNWRLLRYLDAMLLRLYYVAAGGDNNNNNNNNNGTVHVASAVKYSQYNIPWPLLSRIRFDGAKIRSLAADMGSVLHVSSSSFGSVYLPYITYCIKHGLLPVPESDDDAGHADILKKEAGRLAA